LSEQPAQSDAAGNANQQAAASSSDVSAEDTGMEQQLDSMLAGIGEQAPGETDQQQEDDLARQIQQLLDEAQREVEQVSGETDPAASEPPASAAESAETTQNPAQPAAEPDPAQASTAESASNAANNADSPAQAASNQAQASTETADASGDGQGSEAATSAEVSETTIEELDSLLASEAEEAVEGDFESPGQVLGEVHAEGVATQPEADPQDSSGEPTETSTQAHAAAGEAEPSAAGPAEPATASAGQSETAGASASEGADESLATVQADPTPAGTQDFQAEADYVAAELDSQPEHQPRQADEPAAASQAEPARATQYSPSSTAAQAQPAQAWRLWLGALGKTILTLGRLLRQIPMRQICATINAPLQQLSPAVRQTVGYVGLLTLFNAVALLLASLIFG
jgi:hypothetical protein